METTGTCALAAAVGSSDTNAKPQPDEMPNVRAHRRDQNISAIRPEEDVPDAPRAVL